MKSTGYTLTPLLFLQSYVFLQPRNPLKTQALRLFWKFPIFNICHLHIPVQWQKEAELRVGNKVMEPQSLQGFLLCIVQSFPLPTPKGLQKRAFITFIRKCFPSLAADSHKKKSLIFS